MAQRSIHYEAAFEDFLRFRRVSYIAVDEAKKAIFGRVSLKSFDFMVCPENKPALLVDVKGRKFPDLQPGKITGSGAWQNWIANDDVEGLRKWVEILGASHIPVLVFAYWLQGQAHNSPFEDVHLFRGNYYAFAAVELEKYVLNSKPRSKKWNTISVPVQKFSKICVDFEEYL